VSERTVGRLTLLSRAPQFRLLFAATTGSAFGTYLTATVLTLQIQHLTDSGPWVAALLVADFLPIVVIGLTLGPLIDRLSRKRLMVTSDLVRVGVFCALPFVHRPGVIVGLAGVAGIATGFFRPAVYAGLPNLVDGDADLTEANSLLGAAENVSWMVGPVLAGAVYTFAGVNPAYVLNAVTFLFSALLVARIPAARLQSEESLSRGHWRDVGDGIGLVLRRSSLRTVLVVWTVVIVGNAGLNVGEVFFAKHSLHTGGVGFGALVGATGLGLVIGSLITPFVIGRVGLRRLYPGAIAVMAIGALAASRATSIWVAAPLVAFMTLGNAAAIVCNQLLVQRGSPDAMRGRAIAVLMSATYAVLAPAMVCAGLLLNAFGARVVWTIAGLVYLAGSLIALVMIRALPRSSKEPVAQVLESVRGNGAGLALAPEGLRAEQPHPVERIRTLLDEVEIARVADAERLGFTASTKGSV
jgi:MFS family permease